MKNFARLTLFFTSCFFILFLSALLLGLLAFWIDSARIVPLDSGQEGASLAPLAWRALSVALYGSILLGLSYTSRRRIAIPLAIIGITLLGFVFASGISLGLARAEFLGAAFRPAPPSPAGPGLILSQRDNAMVLLRESADVHGPRVVSIPGRPLIYQEAPLGPTGIRNLPSFTNEVPWFIQSLGIDFSLTAGELRGRLGEGFFSFAPYILSLILLLASLRFLLELSRWPLANLFFGALVFRGVLALETFLNARETGILINSFLNNRLPGALITPAIFCALGLVIILYTLLTRIIRPRRVEDD